MTKKDTVQFARLKRELRRSTLIAPIFVLCYMWYREKLKEKIEEEGPESERSDGKEDRVAWISEKKIRTTAPPRK